MCIEKCIESILELANVPLLLVLWLVVLFPSPAPDLSPCGEALKAFSISNLNSYLF